MRRFGQGRFRYWCPRRLDGARVGGREAVGVPHFAPAACSTPCAARAWPPRQRRCSFCEPAAQAHAAVFSAVDLRRLQAAVGRARLARCLTPPLHLPSPRFPLTPTSPLRAFSITRTLPSCSAPLAVRGARRGGSRWPRHTPLALRQAFILSFDFFFGDSFTSFRRAPSSQFAALLPRDFCGLPSSSPTRRQRPS